MQLIIKNDQLADHFEAEENSPFIAWQNGATDSVDEEAVEAWVSAHPEAILYGYLSSFSDVCDEQGLTFDLTYDTVRDLGPALLAFLLSQQAYYDNAALMDIVAKTLAAALSYLAINEEGCWFLPIEPFSDEAETIVDPETFDAETPLWAGALIMAVGKDDLYTDFLPYAEKVIQTHLDTQPPCLQLQFAPVIEEYRQITGTDLSAHGLTDCSCGVSAK